MDMIFTKQRTLSYYNYCSSMCCKRSIYLPPRNDNVIEYWFFLLEIYITPCHLNLNLRSGFHFTHILQDYFSSNMIVSVPHINPIRPVVKLIKTNIWVYLSRISTLLRSLAWEKTLTTLSPWWDQETSRGDNNLIMGWNTILLILKWLWLSDTVWIKLCCVSIEMWWSHTSAV